MRRGGTAVGGRAALGASLHSRALCTRPSTITSPFSPLTLCPFIFLFSLAPFFSLLPSSVALWFSLPPSLLSFSHFFFFLLPFAPSFALRICAISHAVPSRVGQVVCSSSFRPLTKQHDVATSNKTAPLGHLRASLACQACTAIVKFEFGGESGKKCMVMQSSQRTLSQNRTSQKRAESRLTRACVCSLVCRSSRRGSRPDVPAPRSHTRCSAPRQA